MANTYMGVGVNSSGTLTITPSIDANAGPINVTLEGYTVTAPISGNWADLSGWIYDAGVNQIDVRLAVFRASDGRREAQGTAAFHLTSTTPAFQGHLTAGEITQYNAAVSGTAYILGLSWTSSLSALVTGYDPAGASGDSKAGSTDYATAGWPDPDPATGGNYVRIILRAGIAAPGGRTSKNIHRVPLGTNLGIALGLR